MQLTHLLSSNESLLKSSYNLLLVMPDGGGGERLLNMLYSPVLLAYLLSLKVDPGPRKPIDGKGGRGSRRPANGGGGKSPRLGAPPG